MKSYLLDTKSVLAFLGNESGADSVEELLWKAVQDQRLVCLPVTSWGEVISAVWRSQGEHYADEVQKRLQQLPIELVPVDVAIAQAAVGLSAKQGLPYPDCLVIATAQQRKAVLVTTDKHLATLQLGIRVQVAA
jgi:uncharacterized protein